MFKRIRRYLKDPYYEIGKDMLKKHPQWMSDKWHIKVQYLTEVGEKINLNDPQSFTEKVQWLKLHDHNSLYTTLVDKHKVKSWVTERIGLEHVLPTLFTWQSADEIDINLLPDKFVLKCNHDCGSVIICKDKSKFNLEEAKKKLSIALGKNHYYYGREWPYKNVKPLIMAEPYITNSHQVDYLTDYKLYCFDGEPRIIKTVDRQESVAREDIYDIGFNLLPTHLMHFPTSGIVQSKPEALDEMIMLAKILSKGLPLCRVDFYHITSETESPRILLGEMSLYDSAGYDPFVPKEWNLKFGEMIHLPKH